MRERSARAGAARVADWRRGEESGEARAHVRATDERLDDDHRGEAKTEGVPASGERGGRAVEDQTCQDRRVSGEGMPQR